MRLRYAPTAARELDALLIQIAESSPQGAARIGAAVKKAKRVLLDQPHIGQLNLGPLASRPEACAAAFSLHSVL